jgi:D-glycero-alpha-D-manno-heptose 1-phosphate guanylyltransferase
MEAVVLAGGLGTRLRSVVPDLPKPMAPVAGRPFLEILLSSLARQGVARVVLSVGHRAAQIVEHFGAAYDGLEIDYAVEDSPLGTGGAVRLALSRCRSEPVLVLNGDTFLELDLPALWACWRADRAPVVVAREVEDTARFGRMRIEDGRVIAFAEKGVAGPGTINGGVYLVPRDLLDGFEPGRAFSIESDFFTPQAGRRTIRAFVARGRFIDIGVPDDYARAQSLLAPFARPA